MSKIGINHSWIIVVVAIIMLICSTNAMAQEAHKYKCVAITNYGEPWTNEDIRYYIEFNDDNTLTRWILRDGEWKYGKTYELSEVLSDGTKVYVAYERITSGSNGVCTDWLHVSMSRSRLLRVSRCPLSEYAFNYEFEEY